MAIYSVPQTTVGANTTYVAANLQAWIGEIRAALAGVGLVQTSDTGQVNPATATAATVNTLVGYEIWRFSDAAQATDPVFLRVEYWRGQTVASHWQLRIAVGEGTNGAGTLTGTVSSTYTCSGYFSSGSASGTGVLLAFFNDGVFWLADQAASTSTSYPYAPRNFVLVARTRDNAGALDGRGILLHAATYSDGSYGVNGLQFVRRLSSSPLVHTSSPNYCMAPSAPANPVEAGTGDLLAWPYLYYDRGVGVVTAQCAFASPRDTLSAPTSPTSFVADPFGLGSRTWVSWRWAPWVSFRASAGQNYLVVNLPWDA